MTRVTRRDLFAATLAVAATRAAAQVPELGRQSAFVTKHSGVFGGRLVDYIATVGETVICDAKGQPTVRFVSTSYVGTGVNSATRAVLFVFNGGPSAASSILHMLALGPKSRPVRLGLYHRLGEGQRS
jgi:carboxypeptidase C (cathepsin A)